MDKVSDALTDFMFFFDKTTLKHCNIAKVIAFFEMHCYFDYCLRRKLEIVALIRIFTFYFEIIWKNL